MVFVVGLRFRPAYGTCVVACALRLHPAVSGSGVRYGRACCGLGFGCAQPLLWGGVGVCVCLCARPAWSPAPPGWERCAGVRVCARAPLVPRLSWLGCAVWACVLVPGLGCAPPFLVALSGCVFVFVCLALALWCRSPAVPVPGLVVPVPPSPLFRAGLLALFFFSRAVCLRVLVPLFPVGRSSWLGVAGFGWVVPLCPFGGPVFGAFWVGGLAASCGLAGGLVAVGHSLGPPPPPCFFFFWGGSACSSLCVPWAGARTGPHSVRKVYSVFSTVFLLLLLLVVAVGCPAAGFG